jgi:hypothetical protein
VSVERKAIDPAIAVTDRARGEVEAIVAVMGNVDLGGDIIHPGAFVKTIKERGHRVRVLDQHQRDSVLRVLGRPIELREVSRSELPYTTQQAYPDATGGLYAKIQFTMGTPEGKGAFERVLDGALGEWSIGYVPLDSDKTFHKSRDGSTRTVRNLRTIALQEISIVIDGMNQATSTMSAKSAEEKYSAGQRRVPGGSPHGGEFTSGGGVGGGSGAYRAIEGATNLRYSGGAAGAQGQVLGGHVGPTPEGVRIGTGGGGGEFVSAAGPGAATAPSPAAVGAGGGAVRVTVAGKRGANAEALRVQAETRAFGKEMGASDWRSLVGAAGDESIAVRWDAPNRATVTVNSDGRRLAHRVTFREDGGIVAADSRVTGDDRDALHAAMGGHGILPARSRAAAARAAGGQAAPSPGRLTAAILGGDQIMRATGNDQPFGQGVPQGPAIAGAIQGRAQRPMDIGPFVNSGNFPPAPYGGASAMDRYPRRRGKADLGDVIQGLVHKAFTALADDLYIMGEIDRDERIELAGALGKALDQIEESIPRQLAAKKTDTYADDLYYAESKAGQSVPLGTGTSRYVQAAYDALKTLLTEQGFLDDELETQEQAEEIVAQAEMNPPAKSRPSSQFVTHASGPTTTTPDDVLDEINLHLAEIEIAAIT